jgi:hypothetical protein
VRAAGIDDDGVVGHGFPSGSWGCGNRIILDVRACISLSGITSRTRQTNRTPEPCPDTRLDAGTTHRLHTKAADFDGGLDDPSSEHATARACRAGRCHQAPEEAGGRDRLERLLAEVELEKDTMQELIKGNL